MFRYSVLDVLMMAIESNQKTEITQLARGGGKLAGIVRRTPKSPLGRGKIAFKRFFWYIDGKE